MTRTEQPPTLPEAHRADAEPTSSHRKMVMQTADGGDVADPGNGATASAPGEDGAPVQLPSALKTS